MDTKKDFLCLDKNELIYSKAVDAEGEYQESLPAYLDDIYRVVKCTAHSFVVSADISFNELKIYGKTNIQITYYNENSELCFADFEEDFSKSITIDNLSDTAFISVSSSDKYTNFRVINQRRIDVHTMTVLHIGVYDSVKCPTICSCENSKLKTEKIITSNVIAAHIDRIEFDEEVTLPANSEAIGRIISSFAYPQVTETKIIKDKILVKVNLNVSLLYTADSENEDIEKAEYSFSLSKIMDIGGIDDGDFVVPDIDIGSLFFKIKGAANEKISLINLFGEVALNLTFIRNSECEVVTDGYILGSESDCKYVDYVANTDGRLIQDNRQITVPLEFNAEISDIKELGVFLKSATLRDGKALATVDANAVISNDGGLASIGSSADIELPVDCAECAILSLGTDSFDYTLSSSNRVDLRLNIKVTAFCYSSRVYRVLSDITVGADAKDSHTLTVYFGKENENVWDIAKAFLSDKDLIINENSLSGDVLDSPKVLIIPRV